MQDPSIHPRWKQHCVNAWFLSTDLDAALRGIRGGPQCTLSAPIAGGPLGPQLVFWSFGACLRVFFEVEGLGACSILFFTVFRGGLGWLHGFHGKPKGNQAPGERFMALRPNPWTPETFSLNGSFKGTLVEPLPGTLKGTLWASLKGRAGAKQKLGETGPKFSLRRREVLEAAKLKDSGIST